MKQLVNLTELSIKLEKRNRELDTQVLKLSESITTETWSGEKIEKIENWKFEKLLNSLKLSELSSFNYLSLSQSFVKNESGKFMTKRKNLLEKQGKLKKQIESILREEAIYEKQINLVADKELGGYITYPHPITSTGPFKSSEKRMEKLDIANEELSKVKALYQINLVIVKELGNVKI